MPEQSAVHSRFTYGERQASQQQQQQASRSPLHQLVGTHSFATTGTSKQHATRDDHNQAACAILSANLDSDHLGASSTPLV